MIMLMPPVPMRPPHVLRLILLVLLMVAPCGCSDGGAQPATGTPPDRAAAQNPAESPTEATRSTGPKVVFLGDSISAGLHLPRDAAYPAQLAALLAEEGLGFQLVNAGLSGDTTAGGAARLDWVLGQKPDLLVVQLGGNDALRGQPLAAIEKNLRSIVRRARKAGARVLILGMRIPPNYGPEYVEGFAALYPRVADEEGAACVEYFMRGVGGVPELNLEDGLHPTRAGHRRLAENLLAAFRRELRQLTPAGE